MIKSVNKNDSEFSSFCDRDVFGTRIKAYYNCYSTDYDFVKFWVQIEEEKIVSAISRVDGDVTICSLGDNVDELKEFLNIVGFSTIQCEKKIVEKLHAKEQTNGYVVEYIGTNYKAKEIALKNDFELKEIYDIIRSAKLIGVGDYLPWLSDVTFRRNRGATEAVLSRNGEGCAMVIFKTDKASLLGGVATKPECRGKGIAGALVTYLAKKEIENGNRVELLCKHDSIVEFYKSIGFIVKNEWSIIDETGLL